MPKPRVTYGESVYQLALSFVSDEFLGQGPEAIEECAGELANEIQDAIEDYFRHTDKP